MCAFLLRSLVGFLGVKLEAVNSHMSYLFFFLFVFSKLLKKPIEFILLSSHSLPEILEIKGKPSKPLPLSSVELKDIVLFV